MEWIKNGAQPTDTVRGILKKAGVLNWSEVVEMKELLTYIVENLVSDPAAIAITEEIDGDNITYYAACSTGRYGSRYRSPRPHRKRKSAHS